MLEEYEKKRHFKKTPEPLASDLKGNADKPIFVVQRHDARNLHYDFRLEMDGVLKSWAVPKQPPKKAGIKRLAIQTEDHPLAYADFEGEIPEGEYGAGKVEIWDKGVFELLKREDKEIVVTLHGEELKGDYILIRTKYGKEEKGWLFFKRATEKSE
jgi:DNA ligase D-like protein (predicted 3'-phosphoesterase)